MPPKMVSLATSGRRLTGPPEGYGKRKELQVQQWIKGMPSPEDWELTDAASVTSLSELDGSTENLFRSLRDSNDAVGLTPSLGHGGKDSASSTERIGGAAALAPGQQPNTAMGLPSKPQSETMPGRKSDSAQLPPRAALPPSQPSMSPSTTPYTTPSARRVSTAQESPLHSVVGISCRSAIQQPSPNRPPPESAVAVIATGPSSASTVADRTPRVAANAAAAAEASVDAWAAVATPSDVLRVSFASAAGASDTRGAESTQNVRGAPVSGGQRDMRLQDPVRKEPLAVHALAAETSARLAGQQLQAAEESALMAKMELRKMQAEALSARQEAQRLKIELEESVQEHSKQLAALRTESAAVVAQLRDQLQEATQAMKVSSAEAARARAQLVVLQNELAQHRAHYQQDRQRLEAKVASLQASFTADRKALDAMKEERDLAVAAMQAEAAARKAAEESERKALRTAAKQVETQKLQQAVAAATQVAQQREVLIEQRTAAVRAPQPAAAVVQKEARLVSPPAVASRRLSSRTTADEHIGASSPSPREADRGSPPDIHGTGLDAVTAGRAECHRALSQGLAADRQNLGELVTRQKRALAAAELADARVVEIALSAAPQHLRTMGLAFRAYIIGGGAGQEADHERPASGAAAEGPAAALSAGLSRAGYRVYVDPLTVQLSETAHRQAGVGHLGGAPLVGLSAAVVVLAARGLLCGSLARSELCSAVRHGCPIVVLSPSGLSLEALSEGLEQDREGAVPQEAVVTELNMIIDPLREAWSSRLVLPPDAATACPAVAARLGLPDPLLSLLPSEALRILSVSRNRVLPDLQFLNAPQRVGSGEPHGLQHLKLDFPGSQGASGDTSQMSVELLSAVLQGNSTLTALTLRGCPATAARSITEAVLSSPVCRVATITVSCRVPVAHLAGRRTASNQPPPPTSIDLGLSRRPGGGKGAVQTDNTLFKDEDAEVAAAALRTRVADDVTSAQRTDPPPVLLGLSLPSSSNRLLGPAGLLVLVEALAKLEGLREVNGVGLEAALRAARPITAPAGGGYGGAADGSGRDEGATAGVLDLSGSCCGPVVLALLLKKLEADLSSLPALNLTGCEVGPVGAAFLKDAAASCGGLAALHTACLADNGLGPEGLKHFLSAMIGSREAKWSEAGGGGSGSNLSCTILDLSLNRLADEGCKVLARFLPSLGSRLRILALSHNELSSDGAKALAAALAACTGLEELLLAGNQIGDPGVRELAKALQRLEGLQVLDLQDNLRMTADGVSALAAVLPRLPCLQQLDLSRCHAGDEGARHLAKVLATHPALTSLRLDGCKIHGEGVAHLATVLAASPPSLRSPSTPAKTQRGPPAPPTQPLLTELGLARNQLGDRGAVALAGALSSNRNLTSLDLRANGVGMVGCRALGITLRERNFTLRDLSMTGNEEEIEELKALEDLAAAQRPIGRYRAT